MYEVELRFQVNVDCTGPRDEAAVATLRSWSGLGLSTVGAPDCADWRPSRALGGNDGRRHARRLDYRPTIAGGRIEYTTPNRHGRRHTVAQPSRRVFCGSNLEVPPMERLRPAGGAGSREAGCRFHSSRTYSKTVWSSASIAAFGRPGPHGVSAMVS